MAQDIFKPSKRVDVKVEEEKLMTVGGKKKPHLQTRLLTLYGGGRATTGEPHQYHDFIHLSPRTQSRIFEKCAPLYGKGFSLRSIEEKTGIAKSTIRSALKEHGLELRGQASGNQSNSNHKNSRHSGGTPYGWAVFDGKVVIDPKEQRVIREILKLHKSGISYNGIAKQLNNQKVPTRLNGKWRDRVIKFIIDRQKNLKKNGGSND